MQCIAVFSAGLCCALLLAGCGGPSGAASAAPEPISSPAAAPAATSSPAPAQDGEEASAGTPEAAPSPAAPAPSPEPSADAAPALFDPAAADYTGNVVEMTDTGFLLNPAVVMNTNGTSALASAGGGSITLPVLCSDSTEYIALYAGTDGSSRQEPGTAGLVTPDAYVFISGTVADGVLTADAIAVLNP